jgi:hypothetical protein
MERSGACVAFTAIFLLGVACQPEVEETKVAQVVQAVGAAEDDNPAASAPLAPTAEGDEQRTQCTDGPATGRAG